MSESTNRFYEADPTPLDEELLVVARRELIEITVKRYGLLEAYKELYRRCAWEKASKALGCRGIRSGKTRITDRTTKEADVFVIDNIAFGWGDFSCDEGLDDACLIGRKILASGRTSTITSSICKLSRVYGGMMKTVDQ